MPIPGKDQPCQLQPFAPPGLSHQLAMIRSALTPHQSEMKAGDLVPPCPHYHQQGLQVALDSLELKVLLLQPLWSWNYRSTSMILYKVPLPIFCMLGLMTQPVCLLLQGH